MSGWSARRARTPRRAGGSSSTIKTRIGNLPAGEVLIRQFNLDRAPSIFGSGRYVPRYLQSFSQAGLFNCEVLFGVQEFLAQGNVIGLNYIKRHPQELSKVGEHSLRPGRIAFGHESRNGIQCIEQEMRI